MTSNAMKVLLITALALAFGAALVGFSSQPAQAADAVLDQEDPDPPALDGSNRHCRICPEGMQAVADLLGMTIEDLNAQRWAGRSLEALAEANGIDSEELQAAMQAACEASPPTRPQPAFRFGRMRFSQAGMEVLADELGIGPNDLSAALEEGQTLADLADAADVDLQNLLSRYQAAHQEVMQDSILQAMEDGDLDQDHGNWLLEGLEKGFLGGQRAIGRMGRMGRGMGW